MKVAIVVQARLSSVRLPGKVLAPLAGAPALVRMMERVARVAHAHQAVVATSDHASDDRLVETCVRHGIAVVRGPLDDVLARFVRAVPPACDVVVRLTGDCPLVDPSLVDRHLDVFERELPDSGYVTNAVDRTYPDGLDVEIVSRDLLLEADREATSAYDREHVLPWVRRHARLVPVVQPTDLSALRWTLDTAADLAIIAAMYERLHREHPHFVRRDVYGLLVRNPELLHVASDAAMTPEQRAEWIERINAQLLLEGTD